MKITTSLYRFFSTVLAVGFLLVLFTNPAYAAPICETALFDGGAGSEIDPWQIANPTQLANMTWCTDSEHSDKYFILTTDIDLDGYDNGDDAFGWMPIGLRYSGEDSYDSESFYGTFNGDHYVISNLSITADRDDQGQGLFNEISGLVYDIGLEDFTLEGKVMGAFSGFLTGMIQTSYVSGVTIVPDDFSPVGGVAGVVGDGVIEDVYVYDVNIVTDENTFIGGLVGVVDYSFIISRVYTEGLISSTVEDPDLGIGGIWGSDFSDMNIEDAFTAVTISTGESEDFSETGAIGGKWGDLTTSANNYWLLEEDGPDNCLGDAINDAEFCTSVDDIDYFKDIENEPLTSWDIALTDDEEYEDFNDGLPFLAWQAEGDDAESVWLVYGVQEVEESGGGERSRSRSGSSPQSRAMAQDVFKKYYAEKNGESNTPESETPSSNSSAEDILGSGQCSAELIITDNMKQGDVDGQYSTYNNGTVTQVSLLQSHVNRILAAQYNQAAGPVDGYFGTLTHEGVERLQTALNDILQPAPILDIDGIVGEFTKDAINNSCELETN